MDEPKQLELRDAITFTILLSFLIQAITTLVEAIYMLDLLNLALDEKALGLLFFFSPVLLYFVKKENILLAEKITGMVLIFTRIAYPYFPSAGKIVVGGIAVASGLLFLMTHLMKHQNNMGNFIHFGLSTGLSIILLTTLRTLQSGYDITELVRFQYITWILALYPLYMIYRQRSSDYQLQDSDGDGVLGPVLGIYSVIALIYLAFGAPGVIVRWAQLNYEATIIVYLIVMISSSLIYFSKPQIFLLLKKKIMIWWNIVFFVLVIITIVSNQVKFLQVGDPTPAIVQGVSVIGIISAFLTLLTSPVLMLNISWFASNLAGRSTSKNSFIKAFLLSSLLFIILVFMFIFTNVWGYVDPVSPYFRGLFWLPYLLIAISVIAMLSRIEINSFYAVSARIWTRRAILIVTIIALVSSTLIMISPRGEAAVFDGTLTVMTYNVQQGVDIYGEKNYENQLQVIIDSGADIIGLQESDSTKINTGNSDVVRYFADNLGFYSYYGPKTVMQTYGVALLSRYPIIDMKTFYTSGDEDEIGSLFASIDVGGRIINVGVNHPAGSYEVKLDHTLSMLNIASKLDNVILMGDFNWRRSSDFYPMVTKDYTDTWFEIYPTGVDGNGLNMTDSIDHIFVSSDFTASTATYLPSPASQTDHPAYWVDLIFTSK